MKYFDEKNCRIIFENQKATSDFWDKHWDTADFRNSILSGKNDNFVSKFTKKFISPHMSKKILEGGCGKGQFVYSLKTSGYDAYGVDYAKKTVERINEIMPDLKVSYGNVENLDFPNDYFDGYWSLGVIEHFFDGYAKIAAEMTRVINKKGFLFLTFPNMSPLRKLKAKSGKYARFEEESFDASNFYQFALNHNDVIHEFEGLGFKLVCKKPFDGIKGLKDEVKFLENKLQKIYNGKSMFSKVLSAIISKIFAPFAGHSILLIFKKND